LERDFFKGVALKEGVVQRDPPCIEKTMAEKAIDVAADAADTVRDAAIQEASKPR
jgi:hypothetical protein